MFHLATGDKGGAPGVNREGRRSGGEGLDVVRVDRWIQGSGESDRVEPCVLDVVGSVCGTM